MAQRLLPNRCVGRIVDTAGSSLATELRIATSDLATGFTLGAAIGTIVAYRRLQRGVDIDAFSIVTRWSVAGAVMLPCVLVLVK